MDAYINSVTTYLFTQSWQIALLALIVALISFALKNRSAHIRYLLWLIVLAKCLIPPIYSVPVPVLPDRSYIERLPGPVSTETPVVDSKPVKADTPVKVTAVKAPHDSRLALPNTKQIIVLVWFSGVVSFLSWIGFRAIRYTLWLRSRRAPLPAHMKHKLQESLRCLNFKKLPRIWLTKDIGQPFVWGLLRGSVYLPVDFTDLDNTQHHRTALVHELSHVFRFDAAANVLQILAQAIFWFHPFVWWVNKKIRQEREKCCDETSVVHLKTQPEHYTDAIVEALVAERRSAHPIPSLAIVGSVKDIEERIKTMLRPGKKFYKYPPLAAATIVILMALLTVPTALVLTARAQSPMTPESAGNRVESLHEAVAMNNTSEVKRLISNGADLNAKNQQGFTPLSMGITIQGEQIKEVAKLLIDAGADVNMRGGPKGMGEERTPLHWATFSINKGSEIVHLLVDRGAKVNLTAEKGWTPLHFAVSRENLEAVRLLIDKGADFNLKNQEGWTAFSGAAFRGRTDMTELFLRKGIDTSSLHMAAFTGNLSRVKELVETGTDVNAKDEFGWTALFWSACAGQTTVAEFLIENKADLGAQDGRGHSLLHQAARSRTDAIKLVELLIAKGADVNAKNARGYTPLHLACYSNVAELLIAKGADVNAKNRSGYTPLDSAAEANHLEVAELLISKGADVNPEPGGFSGSTPLYDAVIMGNTDMVRLLIDKGADVDVNTGSGTPLYLAVMGSHADVAELLIAKGANVNARGRRGATPLDLAEVRGDSEIIALLRKHGAVTEKASPTSLGAEKEKGSPTLLGAVLSGNIEQVKTLIAKGADVNAATATGLRLLHTAVVRGNTELVEVLLAHGADVNAKAGPVGRPPLHLAVLSGNKEMIELLLHHGANIEARDNRSYTALLRASVRGRKEIVELLLEKGADIEEKDGNGLTSLNLVASSRVVHPDVIELLLAKGADIEARTYGDDTPLQHAIGKGRKEASELLLSHGAKLNVMSKFYGTPAHEAMSERLPGMVRWSIAKGIDIPPLHQACFFGEEDKVQSLLAGGANVNQKDVAQFTPLHCAMLGQHAEIMQLLVDKGADIEARNCANQTPLYYACERGYLEMAKLLVSNGADLSTRGGRRGELGHGSVDDWTPLHIACHMGHVKVVEYLLAQGADIQAKCKRFDDEGFTALHNAAWNGRSDVVKTLLAKGADANTRTNKGSTPLSLAQAQVKSLPSTDAHNYNTVIQLLHEHGATE